MPDVSNRGRVVNGTELAKIFGVTSMSISNWVKQGMPFLREGGPGVDYEFNTSACIAWKLKQDLNSPRHGGISGDVPQLKQRKLAAETSVAEVKAALEIGSVVPISKVSELVGRQLDTVRARLLAIGAKCAPMVANEVSMVKCQNIIDEQVNEALYELVGYASDKLGQQKTGTSYTDGDQEQAEAAA